jgi:hypothetical protein
VIIGRLLRILWLVVLSDVGVGVVEEGPAFGELVFLEDESDLFAGFAVAGLAFVPAGVGHVLGDGVDVAYEVGDGDGCVGGFVLLDDLGERADVGVEER